MRKAAVALLMLLALGILVLSILKQRNGSINAELSRNINGFMRCLPSESGDRKTEEVRKTLERFKRSVAFGKVAKKDRNNVLNIMEHYIEQGSISKKELSIFMAKVSYYTFRLADENRASDGRIKPPDHPLLEKPDQAGGTDSSGS